jgi:hypothetical protein
MTILMMRCARSEATPLGYTPALLGTSECRDAWLRGNVGDMDGLRGGLTSLEALGGRCVRLGHPEQVRMSVEYSLQRLLAGSSLARV